MAMNNKTKSRKTFTSCGLWETARPTKPVVWK